MKGDRQSKILEIINDNVIETQSELISRLKSAGIKATQATISRDIHELKLTKVLLPDGRKKYVSFMGESKGDFRDKYYRVLKEGFLSMDMAQNILVVKTVSGMAMAVAAALDALKFEEIVGCIAGDDTIMVAVRTVEDTQALMGKIYQLIEK